jgi:hypothetical protein
MARVQVLALGCWERFMKMSFITTCALLLIGCASTQPKASLSAEQATKLAILLANAKAEAVYQRQPFHDGKTARFESGGWTWEELATGDIKAEVEIAADGSTNHVSLNLLSEIAVP